jgi:hypothetical protein
MENYMEKYELEEIEETKPSMFLVSPANYVGGYRLGNHKKHYVQFNLNKKPKWLHRQCMRIFLGWYWFDEPNNEPNNEWIKENK